MSSILNNLINQLSHLFGGGGTGGGEGQAPAINCYFNDNTDGRIIVHDVNVPTGWSHENTYDSALVWNAGQEGGGYCGIQHARQGHDTIFSLWNSPTTSQKPTAAYLGHGSAQHSFGGEGTGLQTINYGYGWSENRWYTIVVRNWAWGNHTRFGMWIHDQSGRRWFHHATMEYPVANVVFKGSTACFLEDWANDGQNGRSVYYNNGYKYSTSNQWIPFQSCTYGVHGGTTHANNYDVRKVGTKLWLATGGTVKPTTGKSGSITFDPMPSQPSVPAITFSVTSATHNHVSWSVPASSTPQFSYTIKIQGQTVAYGYDSETRSASFNHPSGSNIEVELEDILGRRVSHSHHIARL